MNFQKEFDINSLIHEPFDFPNSRELEESPWLSEISGSSPELSSVQPTPHLLPLDSAFFHEFGLGINEYPPILPQFNAPKTVLPPFITTSRYDVSRITGNHPRLDTARDLLSRTTEEECQKILETPIQRKPGRPSKNPYLANEPQEFVSIIVDDGTVDKLTLRKLKNRESADNSRKRRQERMKMMESFTSRLKAENYQLQELIKALENGEL